MFLPDEAHLIRYMRVPIHLWIGLAVLTLSQAAMVFCLMNRDIATTVPGVKNVGEIEELAGCVALPPIPPHHLARLRALCARDFRG